MNGNEALLAIAVSEIRDECKNIPNVEDRLRAAMRAARNFFMSGTETFLLNAAAAAVVMETEDEADKVRVCASFKALNAVNNLMSDATGASADVVADLLDEAGAAGPLPILQMWHESGMA